MMQDQLILLVDDSQDDVSLVVLALKDALVRNPVQVVWSGEKAISYMKGEGKYANRARYPLPALILLDLFMPRVNGFEVLKWIRLQPQLNSVCVIVLTDSQNPKDVKTAYAMGANSFLSKQEDFHDSVRLIRMMASRWLLHANEPSAEDRQYSA